MPLLFSYGTLQQDDVQLAAADQYEEPAEYKRIATTLGSGNKPGYTSPPAPRRERCDRHAT